MEDSECQVEKMEHVLMTWRPLTALCKCRQALSGQTAESDRNRAPSRHARAGRCDPLRAPPRRAAPARAARGPAQGWTGRGRRARSRRACPARRRRPSRRTRSSRARSGCTAGCRWARRASTRSRSRAAWSSAGGPPSRTPRCPRPRARPGDADSDEAGLPDPHLLAREPARCAPPARPSHFPSPFRVLPEFHCKARPDGPVPSHGMA